LYTRTFCGIDKHACDSNSWWANEGTALRVRAAKDIPAGGELTFNYLLTRASEFHGRQASLQDKSCFDCTCELCRAEPKRLQPAEPLLGELSHTVKNNEKAVVSL
jgi:hypothetical protein